MSKDEEKFESMRWASPERIRYEVEHHPYFSRYGEWKSRNPNIVSGFRRLVLMCLERGKFFGISLITERLRWDFHFDYDESKEEFKISNSHRAIIIRELMLEFPKLLTLCRIKRLSFSEPYFDDDGKPVTNQLQGELL